MWNYGEIDKYITTEHLALILDLLRSDTNWEHYGFHMISGINRDGNNYILSFTMGGSGFNQQFEIKEGKAIAGEKSHVWMS